MESNAFLTPEEEAPLKTCVNCKERPCIKTGNICDAVEKLLPKPQSGTNSRKLRFYEPELVEDLAVKYAFKLRYGRRKGISPSED
jgi:hypothetical protein